MSNSNEPKPANPAQLVIQTESLLGGKRVEKINLDANYVDPRNEFEERLSEWLIGRTPEDTVFSAFTTVSFGAFVSSILYHTTWFEAFTIPLIVLAVVFVFCILYAVIHLPKAGIPLAFRLVLVALGSTIGAYL
jgi:hypothetical protein